jgi:hypothetical protein
VVNHPNRTKEDLKQTDSDLPLIVGASHWEMKQGLVKQHQGSGDRMVRKYRIRRTEKQRPWICRLLMRTDLRI